MTTISAVKITHRDKLEKQALKVFKDIYNAQYGRISNVIQRASKESLEGFLAAAFEKEPALVKRAASTWYQAVALNAGETSLNAYNLYADYDRLNDFLFELSNSRAGWFADAMTQSSLRQTQTITSNWLDTEGSTFAELVEKVEAVWTGPRPEAAARTETTFMANNAEIVSWQAAGVWGYQPFTMNDSAVRESHRQYAAQGPYPITDTQHRPPYGDVNCRCGVTPVERNPNSVVTEIIGLPEVGTARQPFTGL